MDRLSNHSSAGSPVAAMAWPGPAERILQVALELFSRRGIRDVGVDELIALSGVAKSTFYRHFGSKDALVLDFLASCDRLWTDEFLISGARERGGGPEGQLLAFFDVLGVWFGREDFEGCSFIRTMLEMGPDHPLGRASIGYLEKTRGYLTALAEEAGLNRPEEFARSLHLLMKGSVIAAAEGDRGAAARAQRMALWLIQDHRRPFKPI
jgi:AcrR family transcriptional regulator